MPRYTVNMNIIVEAPSLRAAIDVAKSGISRVSPDILKPSTIIIRKDVVATFASDADGVKIVQFGEDDAPEKS